MSWDRWIGLMRGLPLFGIDIELRTWLNTRRWYWLYLFVRLGKKPRAFLVVEKHKRLYVVERLTLSWDNWRGEANLNLGIKWSSLQMDYFLSKLYGTKINLPGSILNFADTFWSMQISWFASSCKNVVFKDLAQFKLF